MEVFPLRMEGSELCRVATADLMEGVGEKRGKKGKWETGGEEGGEERKCGGKNGLVWVERRVGKKM